MLERAEQRATLMWWRQEPPREDLRGGFVGTLLRALRIAVGRDGVVVRVVPVAAPFVDVVADVVKAERVGCVACDGLGTGLPARRVVGKRLRRVVSPGELLLFEASAGGAFPFGFGGQAEGRAGLRAQPFAVARRLRARKLRRRAAADD